MRRVKDIIEIAISQGCEVRLSKIRLVTPEGNIPVRFLYNPITNGRFIISDYSDDEFMVESEWRAAERRLGITLPLLS